MMDNFETESVSGILNRTPQVDPFYGEVRSAIHKLNNGDKSSNPLAEIIHGHIGALERKQRLSNDWLRIPVEGGLIIPHKEFLAIQDDFPRLENGNGEEIIWDAAMSIDAMSKAIFAGKKYRTRHNSFFNTALTLLPSAKASRLSDLVEHHKHMLNDGDEVLVALPSHLDNPKLWETFNLKGEILNRIPAWAKVYEHGLILASRNHRNDDPRGHDYFAYAAKAKRQGEISDMHTKLVKTWQHERSHGIADALLIDLLKLDTQNPIYEGLPGALGEDGRETKPAPSFNELLTLPYPADITLRRDTAYYAGAKYWEALRRLVVKKTQNEPWPQILSSSFDLALDVSDGNGNNSIEPNAIISTFLRILPGKLNIPLEDLEREYNTINEKD